MDTTRHVFRNYDVFLLKPYLNLQMLLGKHLGLKGSVSKLLEEKDPKTIELHEMVDELLHETKQTGLIQAHGIYRFFPAQAEGDTIVVYDPDQPGIIRERFTFPRQDHEPYLCLADFLKPIGSGDMDYLGIFAVTTGQGIREEAFRLKERGIILNLTLFKR